MNSLSTSGSLGTVVFMILTLASLHPVSSLPPSWTDPSADTAGVSHGNGEEPPVFRTVRIFVPDREFLGRVWSTGIDYEGVTGKPGGWMEFLAGPLEIAGLTGAGIPFEVTDEDPGATLAGRLGAGPLNAMGFGEGSMGGYFTLAEIESQLDSMKILHPSIITGKQAVGYSVEGRTVWGAKISDNPDSNEAGEPEALYTSLIHAREPAGMMTVLYYMWWLLEQYGSDPRASYLVENRQLWFIPVVNPDGYAYNESTNPTGGGLWRKNRRNNGDGTFGIDLNRNFGPEFMWNAPNGGSSTSPGSSTYRGANPFSEPETQTLDVFMRLHQIRTCLNYHTHGRLLIYPYGYLSAESEDSLRYREFAFDMARSNRYASGTDQQTVHYSTRGNSDDYMYGDTTKFRTYAMTPEVGSSFWPVSSQILPLATENLEANLHYSMIAGSMTVLDERGWDDTANTPLIPGDAFSLRLSFRNKGLSATAPLSVSLSTDSGFLSFNEPAPGITSIPALGDTTITVTGMVHPSTADGRVFRLIAGISSPDGYLRYDTTTLYTGDPLLLFADDAENGTGFWAAGGSWGTVPKPHGGTFSFHDSPAGNSASSSATSLQTASPVNLSGVDAARLRFWTRWEIEPTFDFGTVEISTDGGVLWHSVRSSLSNEASGYGAQQTGVRGFDGYTPGLTWVRQEVDLSPYAGNQLLLRFRMATDGSDGRDGWYVDDISIHGFRDRIPGSMLTVSAPVYPAPPLFFGEWPGATDGVDSALGELPQPPPPGPDTFDVRWRLPGGEWSFTDIRDTLDAGDPPVVYRLLVNGQAQEYPLTLSWDRSLLPGGGWRLRDSATSGNLVAADMWLTGQMQISDTGIDVIEIVHGIGDTSGFPVEPGWNLVSLPVDPPDRSVSGLFPDASPVAYVFTSEYIQTDSLDPGTGYWIRNSGHSLSTTVGNPYVSTSVSNPTNGWVLFGTVYCPVARVDLCPGCPEIPVVFGYSKGYFIPDTLYPGAAYWYHGSGDLNFGCSGTAAFAGKSPPGDPLEGLDRIRISDGTGASATLYIARGDVPGGGGTGAMIMPPPPPAGAFDARFESQRIVEYFTGGSDQTGKVVLINYPGGDLTILYTSAGSTLHRYTIGFPGTDAGSAGVTLVENVPQRLSLNGETRLLISPAVGVPAEFRLYQNYPNPFNPQTVLKFDLPAGALVTLCVRNITGQEVDAPFTDRPLDAGSHTVLFDASELATGVYFYSLTAVETSSGRAWKSTGKFLLIR